MDYEQEFNFHRNVAIVILTLSPIVVISLLWCRTPTYGKHVGATSEKAEEGTTNLSSNSPNESSTSLLEKPKNMLGPLIPAKWAWMIFESPCWIMVALCLLEFYVQGGRTLPVKNVILLGWFSFHYLYRSLWYPLVMMKKATGVVPLGIMMMAWLYCCVNGYLQGRDLTKFNVPVNGNSVWAQVQFWFGISFIVIGFSVVYSSDRILLKLKKDKQEKMALRESLQSEEQRGGSKPSHYSVPRGGMFEYVSSPHYFGELIEWGGFCIACNFSLASISFVVWAAANLVPRAIHTHKWYNEKFNGNSGEIGNNDDDDDDDANVNYSELGRKAVIPFIL